MKSTNHSQQFLRQRKFYTYLPLLVLPFMTLLFWALVARRAKGSDHPQPAQRAGLMMSLPEAFFKEDKALNKLSYYQKADADSARLRELIAKDPYYQDTLATREEGWPVSSIQGIDGPAKGRKRNPGLPKKLASQDSHQARVRQKISELNTVLNKTSQPEFKMQQEAASLSETTEMPAAEMQRLQELMSGLQSEPQSGQEDAEIRELNTMLEKILDIQHPERMAEKTRQQSQQNKDRLYPVTLNQNEDPISLLDTDALTDSVGQNPALVTTFEQSGFFSLDEPVQSGSQNAIQAVVAETQTLVTGATVKLRLTSDVYISGVLIPKESFIYGTASLNQERLIVKIESVRHENFIFPVKLSVYDLDGISGIYIPGAISRDVSKQSLSQNVQGLNIDTFQPSLGAQLADAGIQTAKNLAGKKARLIRVTVKAGYQVLLKDENSNT
ncbi:conjugative transposon protein TraM [Dyadobacter psychrophilus]|uniref:Bacteroides conjugative transposon TraM protein n=1 Tax=Dyadobacter psychrophilus TaxID=651661 RepID=A0A1T5HD76_9BACT|nr:conjugative transposon protein TraM [Dyadobacter psychrophilus]SKC18667.1 Bacteroides conjugative transposon TraM protein [Dyadobacter psychrophilus]